MQLRYAETKEIIETAPDARALYETAEALAVRSGRTIEIVETQTVRFTTLDQFAPFGLGNRDLQITLPLECPNCQGAVAKDDLKWSLGVNDGYHWTHPVCPECLKFLPGEEVRG